MKTLEREKFTEAVHTYGDMVYRVACHALRNPADGEDVMQTVFLKLYEQQKPFESESHLKHWLLRVTVNESRRLIRALRRGTLVALEEWRDAPAYDDPEKAELFQAVMALPPAYRLCVYLYYYEGCSVQEVSAATGVKPSTVQTRLLRARERLRAELGKEKSYVQTVP